MNNKTVQVQVQVQVQKKELGAAKLAFISPPTLS
jgi:hypothetical protein